MKFSRILHILLPVWIKFGKGKVLSTTRCSASHTFWRGGYESLSVPALLPPGLAEISGTSVTFVQSGARETMNYVDKCTDCSLKPVILRAEQLDTSVHYVLQCTACSFNWDGVCLLCGTNWFPKYNSYCNWSAMAQAVSPRPVTAEARVRSQDSPFVIHGLNNDTGTGFSPGTSVFCCRYHSTSAPYLTLSTCCS